MPVHIRPSMELVLEAQQTDPGGFADLMNSAFRVRRNYPNVGVDALRKAIGIDPAAPSHSALPADEEGIEAYPEPTRCPALAAMKLNTEGVLTDAETGRVVRWAFALRQTEED